MLSVWISKHNEKQTYSREFFCASLEADWPWQRALQFDARAAVIVRYRHSEIILKVRTSTFPSTRVAASARKPAQDLILQVSVEMIL
jgi:hypothetical protein